MGRPALTDAEKKAKGTFDPRYSAEARAAAATSKVVAFPTLDQIPECRFPLKEGGHGQKAYTEIVRRLHEQQRLTMMAHLEVELLALGLDDIHSKLAAGQRVPSTAITTILGRLDKLQRMDVDRAFPGSEGGGRQNKFSRNGFASRKP